MQGEFMKHLIRTAIVATTLVASGSAAAKTNPRVGADVPDQTVVENGEFEGSHDARRRGEGERRHRDLHDSAARHAQLHEGR
jgi:hypothetical protein